MTQVIAKKVYGTPEKAKKQVSASVEQIKAKAKNLTTKKERANGNSNNC